jgi:predicted membrane protein
MDPSPDRDPPAFLPTRGVSPRLFFGFAVMAIGLLLTLDNLGILDSRDVWRYWPVLLIVGGILRAAESQRERRRPEGVGMLILGVLFLLHNLRLLHFRQLWPLGLLLIGASMVWKSFKGRTTDRPPTPSDAASSLSAFALMGGVRRGTNSQDFQHGDAFAMMGGCEIDLSQASIRGETAAFDIFAMMGGVEIRVPEDWAVENQGFALLGGFEDKTRRPLDAKKRLVLRGFALMGGVEVKN